MNFTPSLVFGLVSGGILTAWLLSLVSLRQTGILQQQGYEGRALVKWCFKKGNLEGRRYSLLTLALLLLLALFNLCFCFLGHKAANLISAVPYFGIYALYLISEHKRALKVPLRSTPRVIRLTVCNFILLALFSCGFGFGLEAVAQAIDKEWYYLFRYAYFAFLPFITPFMLAFSNLLMRAYEVPHSRKFVRAAKAKLKAATCVKVGITGSFGKTSVKNFAAAILSEKFRVIATPASYNTPLGIARTVNAEGLDCDVFLAEMGARKTGDIQELCDMVEPAYGVVTGVCCQHLETFGSLDAVRQEKGVLAKYVERPVLGKSAEGMSENALLEGRDFCAETVELSEEGVTFSLELNGETLPVALPLYGRQAAQNVALAAALALSLGMSVEEISRGIGRIQPVPHRLELIRANGLNILDDSYNSNVEGARNAVEALRAFQGKKCVVTPGLVELGALEEAKNAELGKELVGIDLVILVGETRVLPVKNGYLEGGGEAEKLKIVPTLAGAQEILARELGAGDCVLFLNDLPDKY